MYVYKLSFTAEDDITRIYDYGFYKFGMLQADLYYDKIFECFNKIAANPLMFPSAEHFKKGYRSCVCGVDTIYFSIKDESTVEIITIIGRQDFP